MEHDALQETFFGEGSETLAVEPEHDALQDTFFGEGSEVPGSRPKRSVLGGYWYLS